MTKIILIIIIVLCASIVFAQKSRPVKKKTVPTTPAKNSPVVKSDTVITSAQAAVMADQIIAEIGKLRGLKPLQPIKSGAKSRQQIEAMVIQNFNEEMTPEEFEADKKMLVAFGLVPKDFQYREFMVKLLTEQIAGFYDPKKKELNLADWNSMDLQKPIMAHELTHALQDQYFDLRRFEKMPKGQGDYEMAIHALIEGDATALMLEYMLHPMGITLSKLPAEAATKANEQMNSSGMEQLEKAPKVIRESLLFPYGQGLNFAYELVKTRGWEGVSKAFKDLPQSTEQVLHFEKYEQHEAPIKVQLEDALPVLGAGWKRISLDVNGEYGYRVILSEFLSRSESDQAAAGWGGDQYVLYENNGAVVLAHLSVWDTAKDAEEFFKSYAARTARRYKYAKEIKAENAFRYTTPDGETLIEKNEKAVLVIEGASAKKLRALATKLWTSKIGENK